MFNSTVLQLWDEYVLPNVGPKEARTFRQATLEPRTEFHNRVVLPQHFRPDLDMGFYLGISDAENIEGRNHYQSEGLLDAGEEEWAKYAYFTNPMKIDKPLLLTRSQQVSLDYHRKFVWDAPRDRVVLGLYQTFTFEFDQDNIAFFKTQMSWLRSTTGKAIDSDMGQLFRACSQWVDFEGITVAYGGNKSLHIHIVFNTSLAKAQLTGSPRDGIKSHWNKLLTTVMETLEPGVDPDLSLNEPEKYRRLPNGTRILNKDNLVGIPAGTAVRQIALWEMYRDRVAPAAAQSFFSPTIFAQAYESRRLNPSVTHSLVDFSPFGPEAAYCEARMLEIFPGDTNNLNIWPKFAGFMMGNTGEREARFYKFEGHASPNWIMGMGFSTVMPRGENPKRLTNDRDDPTSVLMPRLPRPLGEMIGRWTEEFHTKQAKSRNTTEQLFADAATDKEAATVAMGNVLHEILGVNRDDARYVHDVHDHNAVFLSAPEGISKSRSLIGATPNAWQRLRLDGKPSLIMYAFDSYKAAREKAAEFNKTHTGKSYGHQFKAVLLPSFSELYRKAKAKLGVEQIDAKRAAQLGYPNIMAAVEGQQPGVLSYFRNHYRKLHASLNGKVTKLPNGLQLRGGNAVPVIFTVHDVAHQWVKSTASRLMFSPAYWDTDLDDQARQFQCRKDTILGLLIHDEIVADDLITMVPEDLYQWVEAMKMYAPDSWSPKASMSQRWFAFEEFVSLAEPSTPVTFEQAVAIASIKGWESVTPAYSGEYGERVGRLDTKKGIIHPDIYTAALQRDWRIAVQEWPTTAAARVIVLTTEFVPAAIIRKIGYPWKVFELDTPLIARDVIDVKLSTQVNSRSVSKLVLDAQEMFQETNGGTLQVISNKVGHLTYTMTHTSAKGSNGFIGENLLQTMCFMGPEQFESLEALNAWTGRTDLVRSRHIDEFNQTCGRNLGFRYREGATHSLLIHTNLYEYLTVGEPLSRARYDISQVITRRIKENAKAEMKATVIPLNPIEKERSKRDMATLRAAMIKDMYK